MEIYTANCVLDAQANLGECPLWDAGNRCLWWVNIDAGELHRFDPESGQDEHWNVGQPVSSVALRRAGGLVLALRDGIGIFDTDSGVLEFVVGPEPRIPGMRFNDGKCDTLGRYWAGNMHFEEESLKGLGSLFRLDADRTFHEALSGVAVSNGLAWSADERTFYFIDTLSLSLDAFDYDRESGSLSNRRKLFGYPAEDGYLDGMCIDEEGKLWVAICRAGQVVRLNPESGEVLARVEVPVKKTTCCTFGGKDLNILYITTGWFGLSEEERQAQPQAGGLFAVELPVSGQPIAAYAG